MKIIAYPVTTEPHILKKASPKRIWMDNSPSKYAYRCLPLNIANSYGWEIITEASFEVEWEGLNSPEGVKIKHISGKKSHVPTPLFGEGTFTFHTGYLFKTEYPYGVYVTGSPNFSKENVIPLSGVIETHWLPFTFTMNWKFSQPGKVIFNEGDPICQIFPVNLDVFENLEAEIKTLSDDATFEKLYFDWVNSRSDYIKDKKAGEKVDAWQKHYFQGKYPKNPEMKCPFHVNNSGEEITTHKTKLNVPDFIDKQTTPFKVPQATPDKNMSTTLDSIVEIAKKNNFPTLLLITAGDCDPNIEPIQKKTLEDKLEKIPDPVALYTMCFPENETSFPKLQAPALYYFIPNLNTYAFSRFLGYSETVENDVQIANKMMQGMSYEEARFTNDEIQQIRNVDEILEKEKETLHTFPSVFQQARSLAKEVWKSGKNAARGLPVLVTTEVGFERLSTCDGCDKLDKTNFRCSECGCFMKAKTQLASASCPIGKWNAVV
jgi:hypothetical protein